VGGSGGGGGSGWGGFEGIAGGGGGGGGAIAVLTTGTITVGATGQVLALGGLGSRTSDSNGCGGSGSGGAIFLQASIVNLVSGARVDASGGPTLGDGGAGGAGRIRADAQTYQLSGTPVALSTFAAATTPQVGFFGSATPSVGITTPPPSSGEIVIPYSVTDADGNRVTVEVEYSTNGGASFAPATPASGSEGTFGVTTSGAGVAHSFTWASATDLGPGTFTVQVRVKAHAATASPWMTTGSFQVSN
jgi:hypothetical protein